MLETIKRPEWLNKKINLNGCRSMQGLLSDLRLNTVCREAGCPNISECFSKAQATFLIMGRFCTRDCRFCNVQSQKPSPIDPEEPFRVAEAVRRLGLKHVVITSVTRDDLPDKGAGVFARTISLIRKEAEEVTIEVLTPDFSGVKDSIQKVVYAQPDIIGHNLETVQRLYKDVRPGADYKTSLGVLEMVKALAANSHIYTKSALLLGLGETEEEVLEVFSDLRDVGCDFLSLGQYLAPSRRHFPVQGYVTPETFSYYKREASSRGFLHVESAPYVRSSYRAGEYLKTRKDRK